MLNRTLLHRYAVYESLVLSMAKQADKPGYSRAVFAIFSTLAESLPEQDFSLFLTAWETRHLISFRGTASPFVSGIRPPDALRVSQPV